MACTPTAAGKLTVPRSQPRELADLLRNQNGPRLILLTGIAESGKSGIIRGLIDILRNHGITHLAFRVDQYLDCGTPYRLGQALMGRDESPVSTLKGLEPEGLSVLIVDQVDAASEVSGRNGTIKEVILRMINDARNLETVRLLLVCRSFDLDSDSRLKALRSSGKAQLVEVPSSNGITKLRHYFCFYGHILF